MPLPLPSAITITNKQHTQTHTDRHTHTYTQTQTPHHSRPAGPIPSATVLTLGNEVVLYIVVLYLADCLESHFLSRESHNRSNMVHYDLCCLLLFVSLNENLIS